MGLCINGVMLGLSGQGEIQIVNHGANRNVRPQTRGQNRTWQTKNEKKRQFAIFHKSLGIRAF
jgi:hypothetical protein